MSELAEVLDLPEEFREAHPEIKVAVLDGNVDTTHSCFTGAKFKAIPSVATNPPNKEGHHTAHGTHVTSVIFGQPGTEVEGLAPQAYGILVPVFSDYTSTTQLDLARAIESAVDEGVHIINISGGQASDEGEADGWLENAISHAERNNVLVVAAAGNDGCECMHAPAAMESSTILAVGAMDNEGTPTDFSNWGKNYQHNGILAPGEEILGAAPGEGTARASGTSLAAPVVTSVAALMLSYQLRQGQAPNPGKIRELLLSSATPCKLDPEQGTQPQQCLVGKLDVPRAFQLLTNDNNMEKESLSAATAMTAAEAAAEAEGVEASCACQDGGAAESPEPLKLEALAPSEAPQAGAVPQTGGQPTNNNMENAPQAIAAQEATPLPQQVSKQVPLQKQDTVMAATHTTGMVTPSQDTPQAGQDGGLVYAIGSLGYDFGTEARRDSFKQLMPAGTNPHSPVDMVKYLNDNPTETRSLIWVVYIELTPVYAVEPSGPFAADTYHKLRQLLEGQIQKPDGDDFVEKISVPGQLTGRNVKLFSGQRIPLISLDSPRGLFGWRINKLVDEALASVKAEVKKKGAKAADKDGLAEDEVRETLQGFLNRVFYDLRNLGKTSADRALNFAVTNAFQAAAAYSEAIAYGFDLDGVEVEKSPFGRADSDCWDVKLKYFDPENNQRSKRIYRFTIDVSDLIPVTIGDVHGWTSAY